MSTRFRCSPFLVERTIGISFLSMVACAGSPAEDTEDSATHDAVEDDTGLSRHPQWSGQEAIEAVEASVEIGFPEPHSLLMAYEEIMAMGDPSCPGDDTQLMGNLVPTTGCTSESGVYYSGIAAYTRSEDSGELGPRWSAHLDAGFLLIEPDGAEFEGGGNVVFGLSENTDGTEYQWSGQVEGTWVYDGHPGWLGHHVSASLSMSSALWSGEERQFVTGTLGIADRWMALKDLSWEAPCGEHPTGELGIRDPSGIWLWLDLNEDCSGCGLATWDLTGEQEELCVDLGGIRSTLLQMNTVEPWW